MRIRSALRILLFLVLALALPHRGFAADPGIHIRSAEIVQNGDGYHLDASFQIELGTTLEEALLRGVPLHFVTEFELVFERWYFLNLWNRTISAFQQPYRLSYHALTRQYRLTAGALTQNVETLAQALALMGRVRNRPIAAREDLESGVVYAAQVRLRLDPTQLPKPFLVSSIGSRNWNLSSDWYRWTISP
ncbi:MAG: DUF4390 domain-containing protein [Burkholderiales bacterium]